MATTTGNDYDHITISDGTNDTIHYLKDTTARDDISDLKSAVNNGCLVANRLTGKYINASGVFTDGATQMTFMYEIEPKVYKLRFITYVSRRYGFHNTEATNGTALDDCVLIPTIAPNEDIIIDNRENQYKYLYVYGTTDETFEADLSYRYYYDEELSDLKSAITTKAEIDGYYQDMTVGDAEQLVSTQYVADKTPYKYRTTGGSADVGNRAYVDNIVGGTVCWNQIVQNGNFANGTNKWATSAATISASNGVLTITKNENTGAGVGYARQYSVSLTVGHKYLYSCDYKGIAGKTLTLFTNATRSGMTDVVPVDENWHTVQKICNVEVIPSVTCLFWLKYETTTGENVAQFRNIYYIDLTQMFGSEIADYLYNLEQSTPGAGVAWFKALFPKDYYEYNPGQLISVWGLQSRETVGFNLWDEEWEVGSIDSANGQNVVATNKIRAQNYTRIINSMEYYVQMPDSVFDNGQLYVALYDENKNFIRASLVNAANGFASKKFLPYFLRNAAYLRFWFDSTYGTTYNHDICLNLSWSGTRNGEYAPYEKHSYPLDSTLTLRGIPKLDASGNLYYDGDTYESDGTVTRKYGIVDLGTLNWTYNGTVGSEYFYSAGIQGAKGYPYEITPLICDKYLGGIGYSVINGNNGRIGINQYGTVIKICDLAYTDSASFKAALNGVMLVYELAEPTTEEADPYNLVQLCDDWGTEEFVSGTLTPVGHETRYPANLRDKLQHLPNLAASDGAYVIQQSGSTMTLVPIPAAATELPDPPADNGNYVLRCTVSNGTATYSWVTQ